MKLQDKTNRLEMNARQHLQTKLGIYLKEKRENTQLSQGDVADLVGLESPQFISNIERGTCAIPNYILKAMISHYRINERELLVFMSDLNKEYYSHVLFEKGTRLK